MWGRRRNWTATSAAYSNENNIKREDFKLKKQLDKNKSVVYDGRYRSLSAYLRPILRKSLITSVPVIAGAKSTFKRCIKILVFLICLVGFIYHTLNFLWLYLTYPTVMNVLISNPLKVEQPSITVCNRNRQRRSVICNYTKPKCTFVRVFKGRADDFCEGFPRYCEGKDQLASKGIPHELEFNPNEFHWNQQVYEAHTETMIGTCKKFDDMNVTACKKPYTRVPVVNIKREPNICYAIDSLWEEPNVEPETYPKTFTIELEMNTEPHEYKYYIDPIGIHIAVHDRRRLVNPYREGYVLKGGIKYEATVTMTEKKMLPAPYDTNCTDYVKIWKENNGTGPLNHLACVEKCKLDSLLDEGLCIDENVGYPHMEQLCPSGYITVTRSLLEACTQECQQPCHDQLYDVRYEEVNNYDKFCRPNFRREWCKHCPRKRMKAAGPWDTLPSATTERYLTASRIHVTFYFDQFRVTKFLYQPKFESVEMFSYIGGYMGMWLGLSLISLFDFLETIALLLYYPIGSMRRKTKKRTKPTLNAFQGNPYYGVQVY